MWFPESVYTIDILFVLFAACFVVRGIRHGLSGELAHLIALLALLVSFCFFYPQLSLLASDHWQLPAEALRIIVPLVLVLTAVLLFFLLRALLKQMFKEMGESADKVAGGLIGTLRGSVMGLAVLAGLSLIPNDTLYQTLSEKSAVGGWVCNTLTPWAQPRIGELPVLKEKAGERLDGIIQ